MECIITNKITERLPTNHINRKRIHIPQNIKLADPYFHRSSDIDVLISADLFWQLICIGQIGAYHDHPALQKTHFGWVIANRLARNTNQSDNVELQTFHATISNNKLHDKLAKFWQLEEYSKNHKLYLVEEQDCELHFINNVSQNNQGKIKVKLPIKPEKLKMLGDTRLTALRRFYSLKRRLSRDSCLGAQYRQFMQEYSDLGHMKLMDLVRNDEQLPPYYLSHHCVLRPASETIKLRVVFDGSCKSSTGIALNDILMVRCSRI